MCGSTEAHALASKPIRYVFGDERDRWHCLPVMRATLGVWQWHRQTTFYNAKAVEVSTPHHQKHQRHRIGLRNRNDGTVEIACPHCGEYHEIRWADIRFEYEENIIVGRKTYKVTNVWYVCPGCACVSSEFEMKRVPAKWMAENPDAYEQGTRSFWLNAFVSQWATWSVYYPEVPECTGKH